MKGGVGKTTTAVNLSYLAAAAGYRTLLWDLDPQGASSFAFRIRPHVAGFRRKSVENGRAFADAIKATDYWNLDLLPADFAYRKLDRLWSDLDKPQRALTVLLRTIGRDYDLVFLDCPAGFSLLTEGAFAAADSVLVPTIPTILSLRTLARLIKWAARSDSTCRMLTFFSMVDSRKALHRQTCEWSASYSDVFLTGRIPYASVVEQMAIRRMPLPVFAARDPATAAFARIWDELRSHVEQQPGTRQAATWGRMLEAVESLIARLDATDGWEDRRTSPRSAVDPARRIARPAAEPGDISFVHAFDTESRDLERCRCLLQLQEQLGTYFLVAGWSEAEAERAAGGDAARVQIDSSWARQILSGTMSPIDALEQRLGRAAQVEALRAAVASRPLARIDSRVGGREALCHAEEPGASEPVICHATLGSGLT
jgi:cellulose biosynthesis protein BcsQ